MRIAVTSSGTDLKAQVDPRFGRCLNFVIVDPETGEFEAIANEAVAAPGGAGIEAAQTLASNNVDKVVTGNVGPNAIRSLQAAGIEVYTGASGTVEDAVNAYKEGKLETAEGATVRAHFGSRGQGGGRGRGRSF